VIATAITSGSGYGIPNLVANMTMDLLTSWIRSLAPTKKDHEDAKQTPVGPLQKCANVKQRAEPIDNGQERQNTGRMFISLQVKPQSLCGFGALVGAR
jgi:hypothetical protein